MKPIINANKDCLMCGGKGVAQILIGGVAICKCITDQIDMRNHEGKKWKLKLSKDGNRWEYLLGG